MKMLLLSFAIMFSLSAFTQRGDMAILDNNIEKTRKKEVRKSVFHPNAESTAHFQGSKETFIEYIRSHVEYPKLALENAREGIVIVEFVVGKDGSIRNPKIVQSLGFGCDEVALALVNNMPKWKPAQQGIRAVRSKVRLPLAFYL